MAKYSYTDSNGITFNNLDSNPSPKKTINGKLFSTQNDFEFANEDGIKPVFNAVEIDWNGVEITSTAFPAMDRTINTTGDLLSWIKEGIEEAAVSGRTSGVVRRSLWIN